MTSKVRNARLARDPRGPNATVYDEVHEERERAHEKHAGNSREDQYWFDGEWLAILVEEMGEVAHELTYDVYDPDSLEGKRPMGLRKELVQVAAMACAWIDAIDEQER